MALYWLWISNEGVLVEVLVGKMSLLQILLILMIHVCIVIKLHILQVDVNHTYQKKPTIMQMVYLRLNLFGGSIMIVNFLPFTLLLLQKIFFVSMVLRTIP